MVTNRSVPTLAGIALLLVLAATSVGCLETLGRQTQEAFGAPNGEALLFDSLDELQSREEVSRLTIEGHVDAVDTPVEGNLTVHWSKQHDASVVAFGEDLVASSYEHQGLPHDEVPPLVAGQVAHVRVFGTPSQLMTERVPDAKTPNERVALANEQMAGGASATPGGPSSFVQQALDLREEARISVDETTRDGREITVVHMEAEADNLTLEGDVYVDPETERAVRIETTTTNESALLDVQRQVETTMELTYGEQAAHPHREQVLQAARLATREAPEDDGGGPATRWILAPAESVRDQAPSLEDLDVKVVDRYSGEVDLQFPAASEGDRSGAVEAGYQDEDGDGRASAGDAVDVRPAEESYGASAYVPVLYDADRDLEVHRTLSGVSLGGEDEVRDEPRGEDLKRIRSAFDALAEPTGPDRYAIAVAVEDRERDDSGRMLMLTDTDRELQIAHLTDFALKQDPSIEPAEDTYVIGQVGTSRVGGGQHTLFSTYDADQQAPTEPFAVNTAEGDRQRSRLDPFETLFEQVADPEVAALSDARETTYEGHPALEATFEDEDGTTTYDGRLVVRTDQPRPLLVETTVDDPRGRTAMESNAAYRMTFAYGEEASSPYEREVRRAAAMPMVEGGGIDTSGEPDGAQNWTIRPSGSAAEIPLEEITVVVAASDSDAEEPLHERATLRLPAQEGSAETDAVRVTYEDVDGDGLVSAGDEVRMTPLTDPEASYVVGLRDEVTGTNVVPTIPGALSLVLLGIIAAACPCLRRGSS